MAESQALPLSDHVLVLPLAMLLVGSRVDLRCTWVVFGGSAIFQVLVCLEPWTFPRVAHVRPIFT